MATRRVFVSGCFDLLHSGHVAFLKKAASFGEVYVGIGRDETVALLKGKLPANPEAERLYMVKSVRWVSHAQLNSGTGLLDFSQDLEQLRPDIFLVNDDGHSPEKAALCASLGIAYIVLSRAPEDGLPVRSSSGLRGGGLPYRVEICGGWLDHPFASRLHPGWVICAQLEPHPAFAEHHGGLASSTRAYLARLHNAGLPHLEPEALARLAFRYENGIDRPDRSISGAQDALGLCMPGVSFQYYDGGYWPADIQSVTDAETLRFLESRLSLYPLCARQPDFDPLHSRNLDQIAIAALTEASVLCKGAIASRDPAGLSKSLTLCRQAQETLFPAMFPPSLSAEMERLRGQGQCSAWKFTGSGGGGWVLLADADGIPGAIPLKISAFSPGRSEV